MCESLIGQNIAHFHLTEVLGRGGMGCVYKAIDEKMDRVVAVKVIQQKFGVFSAREGKALGQLNHPNIVNVFHMDESEEGIFIVMEYVTGETLKSYKNIPVPDALILLKQSLLALEHAHSAGVIHRDIKPGNIMVNDDGNIKVMDFGLAKVNSTDKNRTVTRFQAGTINYMSPEQVRGLHHVDHRSDIYSLGKAFYELMAGRLPFDPNDSDQFDIWKMIVEVQFKPPSHFNKAIPADVDNVIMKALEKDREDRYQDARAMFEAVDNLVNRQKPIPAGSSVVEDVVSGGKSSRSTLIAGLTTASLLLIAALLYFTGFFSTTNTTLPPSTHVLITSDPPDAQLRFEDQLLGMTPSDTLDVDAEHLSLRLDKSGYKSIDTTISLTKGTFNGIHLAMTPVAPVINTTEASFSVESTPPGAVVRLDNVVRGTTPFAGEAAPGAHKLQITLDGYDAHTSDIQLAAGTNEPITLSLLANGTVYVSANQANASVSINGRRRGSAPLTLPLPSGRYKIDVTAQGYSTDSRTLTIRPTQRQSFDANLTALTTTLRVRVNPFGAIYVDGTLESAEEQGWFEKSLPQGRHLIRAIHPAFGEWEKEVNLNSEVEELRINFLKKKTVNITSGQVRGAIIYIDGVATEFETPAAAIEIGVGRRRIEVKKEGFTSTPAFMEVLIEEDAPEPLRYRFNLEP